MGLLDVLESLSIMYYRKIDEPKTPFVHSDPARDVLDIDGKSYIAIRFEHH